MCVSTQLERHCTSGNRARWAQQKQYVPVSCESTTDTLGTTYHCMPTDSPLIFVTPIFAPEAARQHRLQKVASRFAHPISPALAGSLHPPLFSVTLCAHARITYCVAAQAAAEALAGVYAVLGRRRCRILREEVRLRLRCWRGRAGF